MYVRDAKNREEVWLLERIEELGLDDVAFRSRDYVIAIDETSGEKAGLGRIRVHKTDEGQFCELTSIGVLPAWRSQGVGAHVVERLIASATDAGFEQVYSFTDEPGYLTQLGLRPVSEDALPDPVADRFERVKVDTEDAIALTMPVDAFEMPDRLRERFKTASPDGQSTDESDAEPDETDAAEEFGIDTDDATYKYDL